MDKEDKIKIIVADDHNLVREGIVALLQNNKEIEIVGQASDGVAAVLLAKQYNPDIVIMDLSMPTLNGLEATYQIKRDVPDVKVLILTQHDNEEYIIQIIKAGASGYLLKSSVSEDLMKSIQGLQRGETFFSPTISKKILEDYINKIKESEGGAKIQELSHREREVLQLIAEGKSNQEVAQKLFISVRTVEFHRANIMHKLKLPDITSLVKYAIQKGIIHVDI